MAHAKQVFKSGRFLKAGTVLASGTPEWLVKNLREREMGFSGTTLYIKQDGQLVKLGAAAGGENA